MEWLLVIISMSLYNDGTADHFVFTNTKYETLQQCQQAVVVNIEAINEVAIREFNGPATIYCFREDNFLKYMKTEPSKGIPI